MLTKKELERLLKNRDELLEDAADLIEGNLDYLPKRAGKLLDEIDAELGVDEDNNDDDDDGD